MGVKRSQWTQAEILVNLSKASVRMAVNGIEVVNYTDSDPSRWKKGPSGCRRTPATRKSGTRIFLSKSHPRNTG